MAPGNARARETISNVLASMYVFSFFAPAGIHPLIGVSFTFLIQDAARGKNTTLPIQRLILPFL